MTEILVSLNFLETYLKIELGGKIPFNKEILEVRNKSSLVELLTSFLPERESEGHFLEERQYIVNCIKQL